MNAYVVVESVLDGILCAQEAPELSAVAMRSTNVSLPGDLRERMKMADVVLVAFDSDEAGTNAAKKLCDEFPNQQRLPVPLKYGTDFGDAAKNGVSIRKLLRVGVELAGYTLPDTTDASSVPRPARLEVCREERKPYRFIRTLQEATDAVSALGESGERVAVDIETCPTSSDAGAGLDPYRSRLRLFQAFVKDKVYIFDLNVVPTAMLAPIVKGPWCAHNATFEYKHFLHAGLNPSVPTCTMLLGNALRNRTLSLREACGQVLQTKMDKSLQISDWSAAELS